MPNNVEKLVTTYILQGLKNKTWYDFTTCYCVEDLDTAMEEQKRCMKLQKEFPNSPLQFERYRIVKITKTIINDLVSTK